MLELAGINYWAVGVTWLLYVIVGAFWYSPAGFAKQWTKHTKIDILKMEQEQATRAIMSVAGSAIVQVVTLAVVLNSLDVQTVTESIVAAVILWLGFTAATTVGVTLYSKRSWGFLWLNSSYFLLVMTIGSVILSSWK